MDRVGLLTWTTCGSWLPGDDRGFVSNADDGGGRGRRRNGPGTEPAARQRGLALPARSRRDGTPVRLDAGHARIVLEQLRETAVARGWSLVGAAIMANHVHVVIGVDGDPEPDGLPRDFKGYASRRPSRERGRPVGGRWWTEGGSRRKLAGGRPPCSPPRRTSRTRTTPCGSGWTRHGIGGSCSPSRRRRGPERTTAVQTRVMPLGWPRDRG